jgi:hypothetical protein
MIGGLWSCELGVPVLIGEAHTYKGVISCGTGLALDDPGASLATLCSSSWQFPHFMRLLRPT